jgi:hypothetical protein
MAYSMNGPTGPSAAVLMMFPTVATGPVEPPHIATLEELMASHSVVLAQETADKQTLKALMTPSRDGLRPQLFQWAAAGFPDMYIVQSFTVSPPAICSDGETRSTGKYIEHCLGTHMGDVIDGMKALMPGIQPCWSISGSSLRIHVSRSGAAN